MAPLPKGVTDPDAPPRYHDQLIHGWMPPSVRGTLDAVQGAMDEQRKCPNCGEPIGDTDTVCPHCGESLVGG
jgi:hypothetical protein